MNKYKIEKISQRKTNENIIKYKLLTKNKEIEVNISKNNIEKSFILEYIKCPFFILSYKNIENKINIDDSFEISNEESTLDLECQATCGLNI